MLPNVEKVTLRLPKSPYVPDGYLPIENLNILVKSPEFKPLVPREDFSKFRVASKLLFLWVVIIVVITILIALVNYLPLFPTYVAFFLFVTPNAILLFYITGVITANIIPIWFGTLESETNTEFVKLKYTFLKIKTVKIEICRLFNPVLLVNSNLIYMLILTEDGNIFYRYTIGRLLNLSY